jgi:cytoplasmic iron level regulating protein YaaA (DUF328/UPF0246 family)
MLVIISPAKTIDFDTPIPVTGYSEADFLNESKQIAQELKKLKVDELASLMAISPKIAWLTLERYAQWQLPFPSGAARQAAFAFKGEVYHGLDIHSLSQNQVEWAQNHLRILSGLYGVLRPLDMILPYRLEMGSKFSFRQYKDLYDFWGQKLSKSLEYTARQNNHKVLVNLASQEYFKSVSNSALKLPVLTPVFKESKGEHFQIVSIFAKKARGLMARFIIENQLNTIDELKLFDKEGYYFNHSLSTKNELIFTR